MGSRRYLSRRFSSISRRERRIDDEQHERNTGSSDYRYGQG